MLDDRAIRVELVDQSGSILKTSLQGFHNAGPGSTILVKGKVVKKGKSVRIIGTEFAVQS